MAGEEVFIWSGEHGAYWRENGCGYTTQRSAAGRYSRADAEARTSHCGPEKRIEIRPAPDKWDSRFLDLARHVSTWSRDPSTKVGAVIVRPDRTVASLGFNGFPRGVDDAPERYADRETKLRFVCHAEPNAILTAHERLHGCSIYTVPFPPCCECAKLIVQAGIKRVVAPSTPPEIRARWADSLDAADVMFREAGVEVEHVFS